MSETEEGKSETRGATNRILAETTVVDVAEVDAVGGAKPEPEERPFHDARQVAPNKMQLSTGETVDALQQGVFITVTSTIENEMLCFGKTCAGCIHFNHRLGQAEFDRIKHQGSPEERQMVAELRAQVLDSGFVENLGDYTPVNDVFKDETLEFIGEMGMCVVLTSLKKDFVTVHPTQQCCPSKFADGTPIPFLYEPKDSAQERKDKMAYEALMLTASRKI